MCWWKRRAVCAWAVVLVAVGTGSARAETILRLDHDSKPKAAVKAKQNSFSLHALSARDDSEFDRYAHYLLAGKKEQTPTHLVSNKKKIPEPPIQWGDKHAKEVQLKALKGTHKKPMHSDPSPDLSVQWAAPPIPMAASTVELPAGVPAPKSLWAGLGMLGVMGALKWLAGRRMAAQ